MRAKKTQRAFFLEKRLSEVRDEAVPLLHDRSHFRSEDHRDDDCETDDRRESQLDLPAQVGQRLAVGNIELVHKEVVHQLRQEDEEGHRQLEDGTDAALDFVPYKGIRIETAES